MPSKAYKHFLKNMETVDRLEDTYWQIRNLRNKRGKAAFDHITRSAIIFMVSSFEVYIEELVKECVGKHITWGQDAVNMPNKVKNTLNRFALDAKKEDIQPIDLCDEGWRVIYRKIANDLTFHWNTPKLEQVSILFEKLIGIKKQETKNFNRITEIDSVVEFRGEITHRVRANQYVTIDNVRENKEKVSEISKEIDIKILQYLKHCYPDARIWHNTY